MKLRHIIAAALVTLIVVADATAQRAPTQKRGTSSPHSAIDPGSIDNVNLFSGALTNTLALGPEYPIGPDVALKLTPILNSSIWDSDPVICAEGPFDLPVPDDRYNAGHSWFILPFGRIAPVDDSFVGPRWKFLNSDGSEHGLYPRLHHNYPATVDPNVFYSTSSTYLRMRRFPSGSALCHDASDCILLDFPNRETREYHPRTVKGDTVYMPTRVSDAYGNWIDIDYPADGSWAITDVHGRAHDVIFAGTAGDYERVTELRLSQFGGGQATYTFEYQATAFERQGFVASLCSSESPTVTLQALHRIVQPDGSFYEFDYYATDDAGEVLSGGIRSLRLPTGGEMRWTYTPLIISSQLIDPIPGPPDPNPKPIQKAYGVATKELALTPGGTAVGTWTYSYFADFGVTVPGETATPCHRTTTLTNPLGNDTVTYFTTSAAHRWSYSLPFTRCEGGTYSATGPFLSTRQYEGAADTGTLLRSTWVEYESDGLFVGNGDTSQEHNQRIIFQKTLFHDDLDGNGDPVWKSTTFSDHDGFGHFRTQVEDGSFSAQDANTVVTSFNPSRGTLIVDPELGTSTGSTFVLPLPTDPWLLTTFDRQEITRAGATSTTEICHDPATGFRLRQRVLAGASRAPNDLLMVFESEEILSRSTGFVAAEKRYGGDNQASMDAVYDSLCDMTLPSTPEYQFEHTYSGGVRATSQAIDPCDSSVALVLADQTIDTATGLVSSTRDAAGVETGFTYDAMARLTSERPQDDAWRITEYRFPTTTSPGLETQITRSSCASGSTSCTKAASLTWERFHHDGLARLVTERLQVPTSAGNVDQVRSTTYNGLGLKTSISAWGNTAVTTFSDFDALGRAGTITGPDGAVTSFTYIGDRHVTRRTRVMLASGSQEFTYTTQTKDAHGRLVKVCEDQSSEFAGTCTGIETTYSYDVGSRVTRVCQNTVAGVCDDTVSQIRRFVYDNRGALLQERHPEVGVDSTRSPQGPESPVTTIVDPDGFEEIETTADIGNDWTFYTVNSLGKVLTKDVEGSTQFDLIFEYDAAGRLVRVKETNGGSPRLLKEFFYASSNDGTDLRAGKLVQTRRHNWVDIIGPLSVANPGSLDAIITETFRYQGPGGRASSRQTRYSFNGATYAFDVSQTYDALGNVASITYPQCRHAQGDCATSSPARTVTYGYTKGYATSVPGYADAITYQSSQTIHQVTHSNGVVYTFETDSTTGLARPHRISTTAGWDTGTYGYDGSGNIHRIGTQLFRYDRLDRLVSGQALVGSTLRTQSVTYDVYGNITGITTNGSTLSTPTDTTSNRINAPLGSYDGAGNLQALDFGNERYEYVYDAAGMMKHLRSDTDLARIFLYNADDERIAQFDCVTGVCETQGSLETWTLRGLDNRILRTYLHPWDQGWQWKDDYIYVSGRSLANVDASGTYALHTDHLGTVRQVTDSAGGEVAMHSYYPFGQEATNPAQNELTVKFTSHERDANTGRGTLDYMHARFCSPHLGRFTTVDPASRSQIAAAPQTWNRYTYARNNPVKYIDPDGENPLLVAGLAGGATDAGIQIVSNLISGRPALEGAGKAFGVGFIGGVTGGSFVKGAVKGIQFLKKFRLSRRMAKTRSLGLKGEDAVRARFDIGVKKRIEVPGTDRVRIPDGVTRKAIFEVKNVAELSNTAQLRDLLAIAQDQGKKFVLFTRSDTKFSGKLQELIDAGKIIVKNIPE